MSHRLKGLLAVGLSFALGTLGGACHVYDPALVHQADAGCTLRHPPARPDMPDDGQSVGEVLFALRDVVLDQRSERWQQIGFDLDGLCSEPPDPQVECVPPAAGSSPEVDGAGGIDNSFGHNLFPLVQLVIPGLQDKARMNQLQGVGAVLMRIRGWNGQPDDPRVDVTLSQSVFGTPGKSDGSAPDVIVNGSDAMLSDGGTPPLPQWDGNDYWWARNETFVNDDPEQPRVRDDNAYVAGSELVVSLPARVDIVFGATKQGVLVRLTDAHVVAQISADGSMLQNVNVGGRWAIVDLLDTAKAVGVCEGTTQYDLTLKQIDSVADVRSTPGTGGTGVECDAISVGVAFTGYRGHFGGIIQSLPLPNGCMDAGMTDGSMPDGGSADGGIGDGG